MLLLVGYPLVRDLYCFFWDCWLPLPERRFYF